MWLCLAQKAKVHCRTSKMNRECGQSKCLVLPSNMVSARNQERWDFKTTEIHIIHKTHILIHTWLRLSWNVVTIRTEYIPQLEQSSEHCKIEHASRSCASHSVWLPATQTWTVSLHQAFKGPCVDLQQEYWGHTPLLQGFFPTQAWTRAPANAG